MALFTLTLVRHGETLSNKEKVIQGQKDTVLSEKGIKQAQLAGVRLQTERFTHVYSSDLQRAFKTCELVLKENKHNDNREINKDCRLRERRYGIFEGMKSEVYRAAVKSNRKTLADFVPPEGESLVQLQDRAISFFQELCQHLLQTRQQAATTPDEESDPPDFTHACAIKRRRQSGSTCSEVFITSDADNSNSTHATFFMPPQELCLGPEDLLLHDSKNSKSGNGWGAGKSGSASSTTSGCSSQHTEDSQCIAEEVKSEQTTPTSDLVSADVGGVTLIKSDPASDDFGAATCTSNFINASDDSNSNQVSPKNMLPSPLPLDSDIQASVTTSNMSNKRLGWAPNVSLSPVFEHRFSSISSISSGRSGSFDDFSSLNYGPVCYNVLVVSHGGCLQQLVRYFVEDLDCEVPGGKRFALQTTPNTAISKFTVSMVNGNVPRVHCLLIHDKDHLISEDVAPLIKANEIYP